MFDPKSRREDESFLSHPIDAIDIDVCIPHITYKTTFFPMTIESFSSFQKMRESERAREATEQNTPL